MPFAKLSHAKDGADFIEALALVYINTISTVLCSLFLTRVGNDSRIIYGSCPCPLFFGIWSFKEVCLPDCIIFIFLWIRFFMKSAFEHLSLLLDIAGSGATIFFLLSIYFYVSCRILSPGSDPRKSGPLVHFASGFLADLFGSLIWTPMVCLLLILYVIIHNSSVEVHSIWQWQVPCS